MITLIAAIGRNREIGRNQRLPWNIPEDTKHFKEYTWGKVVIMGSHTLASLGRPLPGRKCIAVTSKGTGGLAVPAHSIDDVLSIEHCYPELVVIGGESIYEQTIKFADKLVITHIDAEFEADAFFPEIDTAVWKINSIVEGGKEPYIYNFIEYVRNESRGTIK